MKQKRAPVVDVQKSRPPPLARWIASQLFAFVSILLQPIAGPIRLMLRDQFHWRAFAASLAVMVLGISAVAAVLWLDPLALGARRHDALWPLVLVTLTMAGFVSGWVSRRIGGWESYVALLITVGIFVVHLAKGWHLLVGLGGTDTQSAWDLAHQTPLGEQYFGELWSRIVGLVAVAGLILAVFGGSIAFLFCSGTGRQNWHFAYEWFISRRHLKSSDTSLVSMTALVALVGVALGVGALVAVTAVMSGYQEDIREKILSTNAHFIVQKYGVDFTEYKQIESKIRGSVAGIAAASPFVFNEAMLSNGENGLSVLVKGVDPRTAGSVTGIEKNLCHPTAAGPCTYATSKQHLPQLSELLSSADAVPGIILGSELYKRVGMHVGDAVLLTTPVGIAMARGNAPRRMQFRITGVFRSGMHEFDSRLAYLELGAAQHLLGMGAAVSGIELKVQNPESVDVTAKAALRAIGRYPYRALDWRELNAGIFMALNLQKIVMFLVLTFIVVVAAFNIASTLFMAVVERAHEIAVLKSMGAQDASIMKIFVAQGWVVGGLGTVLGVALGLAVCALLAEVDIGIAADVYMVESLKVRVWPLEILLVIGATIVISHLASIYPALKAARQRPVDAMRYE